MILPVYAHAAVVDSQHLQGALLGELDRQPVEFPAPEPVRAIEAV
jgi:hypothetical protein